MRTVAWIFPAAALAAEAKKPHVLLIVADDLGYADLGAMNNYEIDSPAIDRLLTEGRRLDDYYVLPTCSPTRAALATGIYPSRYGINRWLPNDAPFAPPREDAFHAEVFKDARYATHAVGKWHLGQAADWMTPTFRGFDSFYGYLGGSEDYYTHRKGCDTHGCGTPYDFRFDERPQCSRGCSEPLTQELGTYSTGLFANRSVEIIDQHNATEPLFLYLAWQSVHLPAEAPQEYIDKYADRIKNKQRRTLAGMVTAMDDGVAKVMNALERKKMLDDTIVVFTTDNGAYIARENGWVGGSNFPLRGGKGSLFEGGVKGVGALWVGDNVKAAAARRFAPKESHSLFPLAAPYAGLMHAVDWLPTLADAAGISLPAAAKIDGVSQWAALVGGRAPPREEAFLGYESEFQTGAALRRGAWKLIQGNPEGNAPCPGMWFPLVKDEQPQWPQCATPPDVRLRTDSEHPLHRAPAAGGGGALPPPLNATFLLFNLASDPTERGECAAEYPAVLEEMQQHLTSYVKTLPASYCCGREPKCPFASADRFPTAPKVGKWWAPWCDGSDDVPDIAV